ncbi:MAG: Y-family DNA polymerase [Legionellales bacterium]|nr:Y-family DNA polymerase [Legionellales bacterium]
MFALVDCNNFYASCERLFQPHLKGKPIVVLSNNDGCVIARSNEVKPYVPMGAVAHKFKRVFEQNRVHVFSSNFALYGDLSNRVMNNLREFSPDIEIYSIDEAFLKLDGFEEYNLQEYGVKMKDTVNKNVGIPVSIGFAPTKALCKVANRIAKKFPVKTNGSYVIDTEEKRIKAIKWLAIEDVWGIGRKIAAKLRAIGVKTAYEYTELDDSYVRREFSVVGLRLKHELEGKSRLSLDEVVNKKSIATTRSFKNDITDINELRERISTYAILCAEKLRKQKSDCNLLTIFILTNRFKKDKPQYYKSITITLPYASSSSITLSKYAIKGLLAIYKKGYLFKKGGVIINGITPQSTKQINLFVNENPKHVNLMKSIDSINSNLGVNKVKLGSQDMGRTWKMRQEKLSKRYTTSWDELLEVN